MDIYIGLYLYKIIVALFKYIGKSFKKLETIENTAVGILKVYIQCFNISQPVQLNLHKHIEGYNDVCFHSSSCYNNIMI